MRLITTFFFLSSIAATSAQSDSSVYKNLKTKKFYDVSIEMRSVQGKTVYKANGEKVSKSTYDKYNSTWKNMENCCPCILQSYDKNDVLLEEVVSCTDCGVGELKKFFPNGKISVIGSYKENPTGDWENIFYRGYCSVPDGKWTYFDKNGDTLYAEYWDAGEFIKQIPEQKENELWKVDLLHHGEPAEGKVLTPEQVKELTFVPRYKNQSNTNDDFKVNFSAIAIGFQEAEKTFTFDTFNEIDVQAILASAGIPKDQSISYSLNVYSGNTSVAYFQLQLQL